MAYKVFVTGAAGFIGMHVALALREKGHEVVGYDNFCDYYDPALKRARAKKLEAHHIPLIEGDITDSDFLEESFKGSTHLVHLAAQAGVRYSITDPKVYVQANLDGFLNILELVRKVEVPLVYASSSSVYGCNTKLPFAVSDSTDSPANFYGATKKANELMAYSYHHLYGVPMVGLRFFTVYGPWGRPDMAYYKFAKAIWEERPIDLYNFGQMRRDFTYIDDIVQGILQSLEIPSGFHIYNLGNHKSEELLRFVEILESAIGKRAIINKLPMQPGEMVETFADIATAQKELGFIPTTSLERGLPLFVEWYRAYHD